MTSPATATWQAQRCLVCGDGRAARVAGAIVPWLARCEACGFQFADPQPDDEELSRIYCPDYYRPFGYDPEQQDCFRRMRRAWFSRLLRIAERYSRRGRLLDVGSGLGDLVAAAVSLGWDARGIEPNPFAVGQAEQVVPGATWRGTLAELDDDPESYDLVTCCDVLEHVRDPKTDLRSIARMLRPGGCLVITTINASGWQARLAGCRWIHYLREHLWYFDPRSLAELVTNAGLYVAHSGTPWKVFNARYILGLYAHHARKTAWRRVCELALRALPSRLASVPLPGLPEGQLLVATKPEFGPAAKLRSEG